ncbi:MAG: hypothetical protein GY710_17220 [Desulfobacteraceae bacterium]|nr:hypothetical protein [Desulfobacteraceae bacterium]
MDINTILKEKSRQPLGKFIDRILAEQYSNRTRKMSAIILGDDGRYWVVTLANMERLLRAGYELAPS